MSRGETAVMFEALSVALCARSGVATPTDVAVLRLKARVLPEGDPLRAAIERFAEEFNEVRHDADACAQAADPLLRAVELRAIPVPPDMERRDIHG